MTTKSALEQPAVEPTAEPAPSAAAPETAPQPAPQTASPPPTAAPLSDRERAITGAIAGSGGGSVLLEALTREREELQRRRRALVAELQVGERDMAAIDDRLGHIAALVDPAGKATTGRVRRTDAA